MTLPAPTPWTRLDAWDILADALPSWRCLRQLQPVNGGEVAVLDVNNEVVVTVDLDSGTATDTKLPEGLAPHRCTALSMSVMHDRAIVLLDAGNTVHMLRDGESSWSSVRVQCSFTLFSLMGRSTEGVWFFGSSASEHDGKLTPYSALLELRSLDGVPRVVSDLRPALVGMPLRLVGDASRTSYMATAYPYQVASLPPGHSGSWLRRDEMDQDLLIRILNGSGRLTYAVHDLAFDTRRRQLYCVTSCGGSGGLAVADIYDEHGSHLGEEFLPVRGLETLAFAENGMLMTVSSVGEERQRRSSLSVYARIA